VCTVSNRPKGICAVHSPSLTSSCSPVPGAPKGNQPAWCRQEGDPTNPPPTAGHPVWGRTSTVTSRNVVNVWQARNVPGPPGIVSPPSRFGIAPPPTPALKGSSTGVGGVCVCSPPIPSASGTTAHAPLPVSEYHAHHHHSLHSVNCPHCPTRPARLQCPPTTTVHHRAPPQRLTTTVQSYPQPTSVSSTNGCPPTTTTTCPPTTNAWSVWGR